jgi:hypothetical protein
LRHDRLGPYAGYDSIDEAVQALRRARFRVAQTFTLAARGLVVEGEIVEGDIAAGMLLLPALAKYANVYNPVTIAAVEYVRHSSGVDRVALVLGSTDPESPLDLAQGRVIDVLDSSPVI